MNYYVSRYVKEKFIYDFVLCFDNFFLFTFSNLGNIKKTIPFTQKINMINVTGDNNIIDLNNYTDWSYYIVWNYDGCDNVLCGGKKNSIFSWLCINSA